MKTQKEILKEKISSIEEELTLLDERCENVEERLNSMSLCEICEEMKKDNKKGFPVNRIEFETAQIDDENEPCIYLNIILENQKVVWRVVECYIEKSRG